MQGSTKFTGLTVANVLNEREGLKLVANPVTAYGVFTHHLDPQRLSNRVFVSLGEVRVLLSRPIAPVARATQVTPPTAPAGLNQPSPAPERSGPIRAA
jgi:Zn-dependent membrane protease YugP